MSKRILSYTACCGVKELERIEGKSHEKIIYDVGHDIVEEAIKMAFLTFTSNCGEKGYGVDLMNYIIENKLGSVIATPAKKNPNTQRMVKLFVWDVDVPKIKKLYQKKKEDDAKKAEKLLGVLKIGDVVRIKDGCSPKVDSGNRFSNQKKIAGLDMDRSRPMILLQDGISFGYWYYRLDEAQYLEKVPPKKKVVKVSKEKILF